MSDVRMALPEDVAGVVACIDAAYAGYRAAGITLPPVSDGVDDEVRNNLVWVAVEDGQVAGVLIAVAGQDGWHLANLAVHPSFSGRGLARKLLARMEGAALQLGVRDLAFTTHVAMPDNVDIYSRLGWVETGREGNKVFMARRLGDAEKE